MKILYTIDFLLCVQFNKKNISTILDNILGKNLQLYENDPENLSPKAISSYEAAEQIIFSHQTHYEYGPGVYVLIEGSTRARLSFYPTEDNNIEFHIGAFENPRKKNGQFDFSFYVKLFLDVCDQFPLESLKAELIEL